MADAVTTNVVHSTKKSYIVHLTNISDATGESAVHKVVKANLLAVPTANGIAAAAPLALDIEAVRWSIQGITSVKIAWDHTTPDTALVLCGSGYEDFTSQGMLRDNTRTAGLKDPRSAGGTGDITLTTNTATSGGSYDITLWLTLPNV